MIYLDNSATTFQKPESVYEAVLEGMKQYGGNPGRGGYELSSQAAERVYLCRERVAELFSVPALERVVFTKNTTEALNLAIKGCVEPGDHVIIGSMEHNSVLRPVHSLFQQGLITYSVAQADARGVVTSQAIKRVMTPKTKLVVLNHISNVCGSISPAEEIQELCKREGLLCLIDAAQSGGVLPVRITPCSMIAFAGHKGLYGPQGTGGLCIGEEISLQPLTQGGTGSLSAQFEQPQILPDRFESGTLATPQLWGLYQGVEYVLKRGLEEILWFEQELISIFKKELKGLAGVRFYPAEGEDAGGVTAFSVDFTDSATFCQRLDEQFHIAARGGLHCAPLAHKTLGTLSGGLVRISVSDFTTPHEIEQAAAAVKQLVQKGL